MNLNWILFTCFSFYLLIVTSKNVFATVKKLQLESHLTRQVEAILDTSQLLHQSLIKEDSTQVRLHLSHIERLISLANQVSYRNTNMLHLTCFAQHSKSCRTSQFTWKRVFSKTKY